MKKIVTLLLSFVLLVPCALLFTGCKETPPEEEAKVMNVSLNPELEFVLDANDKVVSVNALNDEGNRIISLVADANLVFENLTAEQAVELFLQITKNNGYLVAGLDDEITISISGEATDLLNTVKSAVNTYFTENNIEFDVITDTISKSDIVNQVADCMREYTTTQLNAMTEEELIELLKQSREETKNFLTQELKDLYYQLRAEEITKAKFEELEDLLVNIPGVASETIANITNGLQDFTTKLTSYTEEFAEQYLNESTYNELMIQYAQAKQALLDARLADGTTTTQLEQLEQAVANAETALLEAKTSAKNLVSQASALIESATATLNNLYNTITIFLNDTLTQQLNTAVTTAEENFKSTFETTYAAYIGENSYWANIPQPTPAA